MPKKKAAAKRSPDDLVVCVSAFTLGNNSYRDGNVYLRTEPGVRELPSHFVDYLSTTSEREMQRAKIMEEALRPPPEPPTPKPTPMVRAKRGMMLSGGQVPGTRFGRPDATTIIQEGQLLPADHALVKANPKEFEFEKAIKTADATPETETRG